MLARSWKCAQVWSKAKLLGGHLGGLATSKRWIPSTARNSELGFGVIPLFSFLSVGGVGKIGPMKFPVCTEASRGFNRTTVCVMSASFFTC